MLEGIFSRKLGVKVTSMERLHRLGRQVPNGKRPVILNLIDFREKETIIRNAKKLKKDTIFIGEDFSYRVRNIRKQLWACSRVHREQGDKVFLAYDKLKINGEIFKWYAEANDKVRVEPPKRALRSHKQ